MLTPVNESFAFFLLLFQGRRGITEGQRTSKACLQQLTFRKKVYQFFILVSLGPCLMMVRGRSGFELWCSEKQIGFQGLNLNQACARQMPHPIVLSLQPLVGGVLGWPLCLCWASVSHVGHRFYLLLTTLSRLLVPPRDTWEGSGISESGSRSRQ